MGSIRSTGRRSTSRKGTGAQKAKRGTTRNSAGGKRKKGPRPFRSALRWGAVACAAAVFVSIALVLPWRWFAPPTSAFMLREQFTGDSGEVRYQWTSWENISPHLALAVVAAEDQKFPHHFGFDFESIADALEESAGRRRGASTITQQVAKNLFLWPGRSYFRKGVEAYLTVLIESLWTKRRILEIYLNVAEFGPGTFGAEAAGRRFFGKPARRLSPWEASLLAAVLPSPKRMSADRPSAYVRGRARDIRAWMRKLGGERYLKAI